MRLIRLAAPFLALLLALGPSLPAAARALDRAEARALDRAVSAYLAAIGAGDAGAIVDAMPPRVVSIFAAATGMEETRLRNTLVEQTAALMKGTRVRDLSADQSALDAGEETLGDGTTVVWVLVPTAFVSETGGKATRSEQPLLAVREGRTWSFLRIDGKDRQELAALAYPFLAGRTFPEATTAPAD